MDHILKFTKVFDRAFTEWAKDKPEVILMTGDLTRGCEGGGFADAYPERYFPMGIAEQNMLSMAGGMAQKGYTPFVLTFAVFIYRRALDQLQMSCAYPNRRVRLIGCLPGVTSPAGATHQATDDIAVMRAVPNMTILECGDATDVRSFLQATEEIDGPVYVRMIRGELPQLFNDPMRLGKARTITKGRDLVVLSTGVCTEEAMRGIAALEQKGLKIQHMHITTLKPFDDPEVMEAIAQSKYGVITMENHTVLGGLGTIVADAMAEQGIGKKLYKIGLKDVYMHGGTPLYLLKRYKMDAMTLIETAEKAIGENLAIAEKDLAAFRLETVNGDTKPYGF